MITLTFPDGSSREYKKGISLAEVANSIGNSFAKEVYAGVVNGKVEDLRANLEDDCEVRFCKFDDKEGKAAFWHSSSHVLAQAVKRLFPNAKLAIGPAIENGFYYDFDSDMVFTAEILEDIEKEMKKIIKENPEITRYTLPRAEAVQKAEAQAEVYKAELINDLPEDSAISFYDQGEFSDLCAGPHIMKLSGIKAVKLLSVAGAYWRGDEHNKMLQRIYGITFPSQKLLDEYLFMLEEAKRRDHRKIGRELDLFSIMEEGPGFPFFHPKGMVVRNELENFWRQEHVKRGYDEIKTPIILDAELWKKSGHWDNYKENMYFTRIDDREFAVKPMNCPGAMLLYNRTMHSYKDLPLRYGELGLVHRHEKSGALHGLMRVRNFTQDDAHLFISQDQIKDEILKVIEFTDYVYSEIFGFKYAVEISTRPEKSMGSDEQWETATAALIDAIETRNMPYTINEGDGAFYGPKIDFHLRDSIGRTWQCGTIQLDFQMPERFDLSYVGADSRKHRPIVIHRVIFGSIERFFAILLEHFAGDLPLWLAPVQVMILTVNEVFGDYANEVKENLTQVGIRAETDVRNEKLGYKIREAELLKIPYVFVIGQKEADEAQVNIRSRKKDSFGSMKICDIINYLKGEIDSKIY